MSNRPPKQAVELLRWIATQKAPATEPSPEGQPHRHLTRYPEDFAWLSDVPKSFHSEAETLLTYLDGKGWLVVRMFDAAANGSDTPDSFGEKFPPHLESDALYQWKGLLARVESVRKALDGIPASGSVYIDNETDEIVPKAGPKTRTVSAAAVRNGIARLRDVQVYLTPKGRVSLAEAPPDASDEAGQDGGKRADESPLDSLEDPVPLTWVAEQVGERGDKIAEKMRRRQYPIVKVGNRNHCERKHAIVMFSHYKKHLTANADDRN